MFGPEDGSAELGDRPLFAQARTLQHRAASDRPPPPRTVPAAAPRFTPKSLPRPPLAAIELRAVAPVLTGLDTSSVLRQRPQVLAGGSQAGAGEGGGEGGIRDDY